MVKVILYMAVSVDGFIAKEDGDSDWVSPIDSEVFEAKTKEVGCIVVGRKTFEQYYGEIYPLEGVKNIVLTHRPDAQKESPNVFFADSPEHAIKIAEAANLRAILVVGGGQTNSAFLNKNLIDEIFLTVHPLILGKGIKIFEDFEGDRNLRLIKIKPLTKDLIQLHYQVIK